jgi:hypothetical protein
LAREDILVIRSRCTGYNASSSGLVLSPETPLPIDLLQKREQHVKNVEDCLEILDDSEDALNNAADLAQLDRARTSVSDCIVSLRRVQERLEELDKSIVLGEYLLIYI